MSIVLYDVTARTISKADTGWNTECQGCIFGANTPGLRYGYYISPGVQGVAIPA